MPKNAGSAGRPILAIAICLIHAATAAAGSYEDETERPVRQTAKQTSYVGNDRQWHGLHNEKLTIPGADRELTIKYIDQYLSSGGSRWLEAVLHRGADFLPYIRERVAAHGLPPEFAYLPIIESAYSPSALSSSGAAGLWQFMRNSSAPFGLTINDWIDERRDFFLATEAALKKLKENYDVFHDWPLALAAYNAGLGAVNRAVRNSGIHDYWKLCERGYLKTETAHYVPKLIAVAIVLAKAGRSGLTLDWPENPNWIQIPMDRSVDLELLAEYSGTSLDRLRAGNAELNYGVTPPTGPYFLKVPERDAQAILAVLSRQDKALVRYHYHTIKSGDTLSALARHFGVSVELIEQTNPGIQARFLRLGQVLAIPALKEAGPYAGTAAARQIAFEGVYSVKKGDTLWSLALAFDIDPETLAAANDMGLNDILREGRVIKTPIIVTETP